ncbi:MAG TPA: hypothetical protein VKU41_10030 [Polyangiaceae bacterium]|nr:hypothetical protein [Polyangiaceae bacterium]
MPTLSLRLRCCLRVAIEAIEKVLHLAIGNEHRRVLDWAWFDFVWLRVADSDKLDALPSVLQRRQLERHAGLALELDIQSGLSAVHIHSGVRATLVRFGDRSFEGLF